MWRLWRCCDDDGGRVDRDRGHQRTGEKSAPVSNLRDASTGYGVPVPERAHGVPQLRDGAVEQKLNFSLSRVPVTDADRFDGVVRDGRQGRRGHGDGEAGVRVPAVRLQRIVLGP